MTYKIQFDDRVYGDVAALSQGNLKALKVCLEGLKQDPANHTVRPIAGHFCTKAHFAGDLRAIFYVDGETIFVVMVGRSTEALYKTLFDEIPPNPA